MTNVSQKTIPQTGPTDSHLLGSQGLPPIDFVCGVISSHGSFAWSIQNGKSIPVFQIKLRGDEKDLLVMIRDALVLKEAIHEYRYDNRHFALLIVRRTKSIMHLINSVDQRLWGAKKVSFDAWRDQIFRHQLSENYSVSQETPSI